MSTLDRDNLHALLKEHLVDSANFAKHLQVPKKRVLASEEKYIPIYISSKGWRLYWIGHLSKHDFAWISDELQQNLKSTADIAMMLGVTSYLINRLKWSGQIVPVCAASKGDYYWLPDIAKTDIYKRRLKK